MGRIGAAASNYKKTGNKALLKKAMSSAAFEALPYINIKALKLYKKIGFEEISKRKNYYGKNENAIIMMKYH